MDYLKEINAAVTICDRQGKIVYMNKKSEQVFKSDGGKELIGKNLFDCHPEPSRTLLREMYAAPRSNSYTVSKKGVKKFIHQAPWYKEGVFAGYVEWSIVIPENMPHHNRT